MKDGNRLVWILDDEWTDHSIEKELYEQNGFEVKVTRSENLEKDLPQYAPYADGVVAQVGFLCQAELINQLDACKVISASGVGYNHIDVDAATKKGIVVTHVSDYCSEEVSDHTITHILSLARRFPAYNRQIQNGKWDPVNTQPIQRFNKHTVGLLGLGRIGSKVAKKLSSFGVSLIAHDSNSSQEVFDRYSIERVTFDELLERSTILTMHVSLKNETRNIIGYEELKKMPKGAFIVNTSRGGLLDEEGLRQAILEEHIAGAGLDVLVNEPPVFNDPLLHLDEVFITPHSAYISDDAIYELKSKTCQNIIDILDGREVEGTLNPQVLIALNV
ncbi:C-terminal binding protein [Siminovitchia acidinfaciens]|uniref:C-terminal binding protein n=1 Tax=Siminovitchia acidinfaciens TaxID=2321395 RepID=A0A429XT35_9BACI|nr:C-terminal binding protein [Siminovitchia acidinfaciens]RST70309.1 C-terminal binding protein [Siminovitchia acidinfaciens]